MEKYIKPDYTFVFFAMVFGLILIFFTPPFQSPDEPVHFAKAFSVSQGHLASKKMNNIAGDYLPVSLEEFEQRFSKLIFNTSERITLEQIEASKNIKLNEDKKTFINQKYHAMYSPAAYVPQSIGIRVFKLFTDSVYRLMIGAKIFSLLFYLIAGYVSVKSIPFCKWLTVLILLMPMSLSLGASVSADGVLIAISVLFFAKVLEYAYQKENLSHKQIAVLSLLAVLLALIKQSFLISLFVLFIPKEKFESKYILKLLLIIMPALTAALIWSKIGYSLFVPMNEANPAVQTEFIISHPIVYVMTLLKTLRVYFLSLIYTSIGVLGWLDVFMFPIMYWVYVVLLFLNTFFQPNCRCDQFGADGFQKFIIPFLVVLNFAAICTIIYVSWAVPYLISPFSGLQGRYFIPLLVPLFSFLVLLFNKKINENSFWIGAVNVIFITLVYVNIFWGIYIRFYADF